MPNAFLTVQEIARRALPILRENLVFPALCYKDYSDEFKKKGDTITVKKPAVFVAEDFDGTINKQAIDEKPVIVTLNKIADVSVELTSKEMTLNLESFDDQVLTPAMIAIAEKINRAGLSMYKAVPNYTGTPGTTPGGGTTGLEDFANARAILNKMKAPLTDRYGVYDPNADAKFSIVPSIVNAEKSGSTDALKEGAIGRIQGMNNYMSQAVLKHTAGAYVAAAGTKTNASESKDATTIAIKSTNTALTTSLLAGDIFTLEGVQYVVTENTANAVAGVIAAVKIYPALAADVAADKVITFADAAKAGHMANLAFHKNAFAFVNRPLEKAEGVECYVAAFAGVSIRVTKAYDIDTKKQIMSIDCLYDFAPIYPELAVQVLG